MKIIIKIGALCFLFLCLSCLEKRKTQSTQSNGKTISDSALSNQATVRKNPINNLNPIYFRASGTEPFWSLELSEEKIILKTTTDSIITPYTEPLQAMDSNVKIYKIQTEASQLNIQIIQSECANAMSGSLSPYTVSIEYRNNTDLSLNKIEGCGAYITDYRLHDIWVLEKLNGKNIDKANFKSDLPLIEINSTTNTITGFAGCNGMNGKLFFENGLLRFTDITTTKMMCDKSNKENEFLKALQSGTTYKIENNRLSLSNPSKELLVFKKID
jgi:heat shock protein HslJ/uncharacterized membrane protein